MLKMKWYTYMKKVGPRHSQGSQLAEVFSHVLGDNISFVSLPFDSFEAGIRPFLGEETASGPKGMYQWIYDHTDHLPLYQKVDASLKASLQLNTLAEWIRQTMIKP